MGEEGEQSAAQQGLWESLIEGRGSGDGTLKKQPHFLADRPQQNLELWQSPTF